MFRLDTEVQDVGLYPIKEDRTAGLMQSDTCSPSDSTNGRQTDTESWVAWRASCDGFIRPLVHTHSHSVTVTVLKIRNQSDQKDVFICLVVWMVSEYGKKNSNSSRSANIICYHLNVLIFPCFVNHPSIIHPTTHLSIPPPNRFSAGILYIFFISTIQVLANLNMHKTKYILYFTHYEKRQNDHRVSPE